MSTAVTVSMSKIKGMFNSVYSELESRLNRCARHFHDPQEALAEMVCFSWINFRSKALRTGRFLLAKDLAWAAWRRQLSGRRLSGGSRRDAMGEQALCAGRVRLVSLSQVSTSKARYALTDKEVEKITTALSSSERESPLARAAVRLDWSKLAKLLPPRLRRVLGWLAAGYKKSEIARKLRVSCCRVSQLVDRLGREITAFFGPALS
jgi:hypothetical protein